MTHCCSSLNDNNMYLMSNLISELLTNVNITELLYKPSVFEESSEAVMEVYQENCRLQGSRSCSGRERRCRWWRRRSPRLTGTKQSKLRNKNKLHKVKERGNPANMNVEDQRSMEAVKKMSLAFTERWMKKGKNVTRKSRF